jgi:hypothetical protein
VSLSLFSWWPFCSWGIHWPLLTVMMKMMHLLFSRLVINTLYISYGFFLVDVELTDSVDLWQLFLLRAAGFLLPCYIMAWAISIMQRQRQRQVGGLVLMEMFFSFMCLLSWLLRKKNSTTLFIPSMALNNTPSIHKRMQLWDLCKSN